MSQPTQRDRSAILRNAPVIKLCACGLCHGVFAAIQPLEADPIDRIGKHADYRWRWLRSAAKGHERQA